MKAAVHTRYGSPNVVTVTDVDEPTAEANELLVKVHATTVNRTDCATRAAVPFFARLVTGLTKPRMTILGSEYAGEVDAIGSRVTSFAVGDRVFGYCEGPFGAHAEYMTVPEDSSVTTMPASCSFDEVAAATEGSHYALTWVRKTEIGSGQNVLVNGATGAIGSAALQLVKSLGATVTAVCPTESLDLVRGLGADRVIDYTADDFTQDDDRYDVVLDAVGKSTFGRCRRLLKPRGVYLSSELGPFVQNPILAIVTPLFRGRKVSFPIPQHDQEMMIYFRDMIESGDFRPVVDRRYGLEQIVEAYDYVETGQKIGNVVIDVVTEGE